MSHVIFMPKKGKEERHSPQKQQTQKFPRVTTFTRLYNQKLFALFTSLFPSFFLINNFLS
jgi:hypothetical protein